MILWVLSARNCPSPGTVRGPTTGPKHPKGQYRTRPGDRQSAASGWFGGPGFLQKAAAAGLGAEEVRLVAHTGLERARARQEGVADAVPNHGSIGDPRPGPARLLASARAAEKPGDPPSHGRERGKRRQPDQPPQDQEGCPAVRAKTATDSRSCSNRA